VSVRWPHQLRLRISEEVGPKYLRELPPPEPHILNFYLVREGVLEKRLSSVSRNSVVEGEHVWLRKRYCGTSNVGFRFEGSTD
jgi:hypothetical protein